ncbi:MAG: hypothetical protein KDA44_11820 [Planctomycetales bacterium]|nr:hypothetical protein [Planctomycetales bacterium]
MIAALRLVARLFRSQPLLRWSTAFCITTVGWASPAGVFGATLATLVGGGSITVGNAKFDNWELVAADATSGVLPSLTQIDVLPLSNDLSNPGVQIQGNGQLTTTGINALDVYLRFRVSALAGGNAFAGHELNLLGVSFGGLTGRAVVSQELAGPGGQLGAAVVVADNEAGILQPTMSSGFTPTSSFTASVNIFLNGLTSTINLASYSHRFSQTGPATLAGDFDNDGDVDGADFLFWQRSPSVGSLADWQLHFGAHGVSASAAVPEPRGIVAIGLASAAWLAMRHRGRKTPNT